MVHQNNYTIFLTKDDILFDFSLMLIVYTNGRVYRIADFLIYLPKLAVANQKLPILVWFHDGGFCIESTFSSLYHRNLNIIASKAQAIAVSVEYQLASKNPLPTTYGDCWEALQDHFSRAPGGNQRNHG
nr:2-hydroxyisoflavanone dehydratase-like [Ipomoea batatas]GMC64259.1 2-hydroxyisoflavanone dehydratase-like [Ipomoea batatas]